MSKLGFEKFINKKSAGKIKEEHRQEKRKSKAALRAAGDEFRRQKLEKQRGNTGYKAENDQENVRGGKSFRERRPESGDRSAKKTYGKNSDSRESRNNRYDSRRNNDAPRERSGDGRPQRAGKYGDKRADNKFASKRGAINDSQYSGSKASPVDDGTMPLNKFIAHSGVCGRREAAELVKLGQVQVNGDIVFEPAIKVTEKDIVKLKGKQLTLQIKHFYFLLNKPKDHITTTKDDKGRKTVLDLFKDVVEAKHLYPVGRLDRNTTGVLLITNDGELAQQLTHPSFEVKKIYEATLDRPVAKKDLEAIATGITLEDGDIKADQVGYPDQKDKSVVGIEIHSGKNRIVRRIFEHLGYEVKKLDRVMFAGLTKKNVERGKWRYLSEKEVRLLKFMNAGGTKKAKKVAESDAVEDIDNVEEVLESRPKSTTRTGSTSRSTKKATSHTKRATTTGAAPTKKAKRTRILADKDAASKKAADGGRDRNQAGPLRKQVNKSVLADKQVSKSPKSKPQGRTTRREKQ